MTFNDKNVSKTSNNRFIEIMKSKIVKKDNPEMIYPPQKAKSMSSNVYALVIEYYTLKTKYDPTKNRDSIYDLEKYKRKLAEIVLDIVKECNSVENAEKIIQSSIDEYKTIFTGNDKENWLTLLEHLKQSFKRRVLGLAPGQ